MAPSLVERGCAGNHLRISRMWGGQPPPIPNADRHVIVATIQTLSAKISAQPGLYEFLSAFKLLIFDEAHRSVASFLYVGIAGTWANSFEAAHRTHIDWTHRNSVQGI